MVQRSFAILLCLLTINTGLAQAENVVPKEVARELITTLWSDDEPMTEAQRSNFAALISKACKAYRGVVPTITPDQHAWLMTEMGKGSSSERMVAAAGTDIFARYKSAEFLEHCAGLASIIATEANTPANWALLAHLFTDEDVSEYLANIGTIDPDSTDITGARMMLGSDMAAAIIIRILEPALR